VDGQEADPGKPGPQYAAFGEKQRRALEDQSVADQRAYWRTQLAAPVAPLSLPIDRPAVASADRQARSHFFALPMELGQGLTELSQRHGATLFMTMQAAFAALLNRATGDEDILLFAPVTGRHRAQSREIIGYFNNILPIRLDLGGAPTLDDLVARSRQVTLDAYKNQDVPFQWNADLPGLRRVPLSRLLFSLDMEWPPRLALSGLAVDPVETDTGAADFDLSVSLWLSDGQIKGNLRYKTALFDDATIRAMRDAYAATLAAFVAEPDRALGSLLRPPGLGAAQDTADAPKPAGGAAVLPRSALEVRLAHLWEEAFEKRPIGIRDDLQSLGASSLAVATLAERIQHEFETSLPVTAIFRAGNVERMAQLLQTSDTDLARSPLAPIQPKGTRPPLFFCEGVASTIRSSPTSATTSRSSVS
jgi:non-ribosomal peptide synthetase component F